MSAETRTTSSTGGQKGTKIERFDLIPVGPLTELAAHFGRGARKYDDHQWRKGYEWSKSYAAKQRHDNLFWAGFDYDVCENDPEGCAHIDQHGQPYEGAETDNGSTCYNHTGSHHLDASNWHGFVLREFTMTHPEHDDRYKPEPEKLQLTPVTSWFFPNVAMVFGDPSDWEALRDRAVVAWSDPKPMTFTMRAQAIQPEMLRLLTGYSIPQRFICGYDPADPQPLEVPSSGLVWSISSAGVIIDPRDEAYEITQQQVNDALNNRD